MFKWLINLFRKLFGSTPAPTPQPPAVVVSAQPAGGTTVSGKKYALLVGINKYAISGNDLNGCVNDVTDMADLLCKKYGFPADNIRLLTDERATQANILERLNWLVSVGEPGDQLVWHYSGHGSQVRDRDGEELDDQMDEIICPHDLDWDNPLTDDILATYFRKVVEGATLTFIADCCHSGSLTKAFPNAQNPHPTKSRFLAPPIDIAWRSAGRELAVKTFGCKGMKSKAAGDVHVIDQRSILMSGCRDDQTSADAYINGRYNGALTYYLKESLNNTEGNWKAIHANTVNLIKNNGYSQVPQLTGSDSMLGSKPFGG